jgi:crotonobetainyl-CoA:carnitine CoA-transferase CaiB-like acyl-CoA transferase
MAGFADRARLVAELEKAGIAWAEVADSADVFAGGAHTAQLPGTDRRVVAMPYEFSAAAAGVRRGVAKRGAHNADALADWLGFAADDVAALTADGVLIGD